MKIRPPPLCTFLTYINFSSLKTLKKKCWIAEPGGNIIPLRYFINRCDVIASDIADRLGHGFLCFLLEDCPGNTV